MSMVADGLRGRGRGREATEARGPTCTLHPSAESLRSAMFGGSVVVRQGEIVGAHRACQPHLDTPHSKAGGFSVRRHVPPSEVLQCLLERSLLRGGSRVPTVPVRILGISRRARWSKWIAGHPEGRSRPLVLDHGCCFTWEPSSHNRQQRLAKEPT